jgi:hypothetical protein
VDPFSALNVNFVTSLQAITLFGCRSPWTSHLLLAFYISGCLHGMTDRLDILNTPFVPVNTFAIFSGSSSQDISPPNTQPGSL